MLSCQYDTSSYENHPVVNPVGLLATFAGVTYLFSGTSGSSRDLVRIAHTSPRRWAATPMYGLPAL